MAGMIGGVTQTAMGTVGGIFSAIAGIEADKKLSSLIKEDPRYTSSPYAANNLGLSQTLLNSRMAGAQSRENNIATSGANTRANVGRNATDSSQALAAMVGSQGAQDQSYNDLALQEGQDAAIKQQNLMGANQGMTQEHKDLFDDSVRRWQDQVNTVMTQYKMRQKGGNDVGQWGAGLSSMSVPSGGGSAGGAGMSDKRLKYNYYVVGKSPSGINIYEFSYIGDNDRYIGVLAQEVGGAAFMTESGYLAVDYSKIDVTFKKI